MKKLLIGTLLFVGITSSAIANEYQSVRTVDAKASDIIKVWKMGGTTKDFKWMEVSDSVIKFTLVTQCEKTWGVKQNLVSDVMLEVKDNKYRISFEKTWFESNETFGLKDHKKGAKFMGLTQKKDSKTYIKCVNGIENRLAKVDNDINNYEDF